MQLVKPRALRPGDCIGIVSTSSPVSPGELDRLTAYLAGRGYSVKVAAGVLGLGGRRASRKHPARARRPYLIWANVPVDSGFFRGPSG